MKEGLIRMVEDEEERGWAKWGHIDRTSSDYMIAIQEELGEVAHAINHSEGVERIVQEIAQVIGLLSRLYEEVIDEPTKSSYKSN